MIFKLNKDNCEEITDDLYVNSELFDYEVRDAELYVKIKMTINKGISQIVESHIERNMYDAMVDNNLSGDEQILDLFDEFDKLKLIEEEIFMICKRMMLYITLLHNEHHKRVSSFLYFICYYNERVQLKEFYKRFLIGPSKNRYRFLNEGRVQILVKYR